MSTDRELLELAAKAAGMQLLPKGRWSDDAAGWFYNEHGGAGMFYRGASAPVTRWNPLTDDGDALRLACKMEFQINIVGEGMCEVKCPERNLAPIWEHIRGGDSAAATRRAIVRAAADLADQGTQA